MTEQQIELVQKSWEKVAAIREVAGNLFYENLFRKDPTLKQLFKSGNMQEQGAKLLAMIGAAVHGLKNLDALVPTVQELGRRHVGYGVQDAHYATVGSALIETLRTGLGTDFTPETEQAWLAVYTVLASTMQEAK